MPSRDPQSYVMVRPLPISPQKGIKIQARSDTVFNPTFPSRDSVRRDNYTRRLQQLTSQGFRSVCHKPYQGIGDPFYLEEQKLILHSLGQWEDGEGSDGSTSSDDEGFESSDAPSPKKTMTAAKFVLRRSRKNLNTLGKEVTSGRGMIRNVRLGHGLFQLIKQQRETKSAALNAEKRRKEEEARNAWQAPKRESDSESETDEELGQEEDLSGYLEDITDVDDADLALTLTPDPSPEPRSRVVFSGLGYSELGSKPTTAKSPTRRKKSAPPRPYTPQHTNLCEVTDTLPDMSKQALFRQLCVLNWILEAMNMDQGYDMTPISKSWSFLNIGGSRQSPKKKQKEKQTENKWDQFVSHNPTGKGGKRVSQRGRPSVQRRSTHLYARTSTSMSASPSSSSSQLNVSSSQLHGHALHDNAPIAEEEVEEDDTTYSKSIFKFLDEYYESLRKSHPDEERKESTVGKTDTRVQIIEKSKRKSEGEGRVSRKSTMKPPDLMDHESSDDLKLQATLGRFEKRNTSILRADTHFIRPRSTPQLLKYQASLPSTKHTGMTTDMRHKFAEILEDKALNLHIILDRMDRDRMIKCSSKLVGLKADGHSFHRTLRQMRESTDRILHKPIEQMKKEKEKSMKRNWFTNLRDSIPEEIQGLWYYRAVLEKLERFGMGSSDMEAVESTSKQSMIKFLKVLETLRDWELCSPDISAAIEFCRDKIVEMTVEEYETWFQQQFPKIQRPQTAPAMLKSKKKEDVPSSASIVAPGPVKVRSVQSAVQRLQT